MIRRTTYGQKRDYPKIDIYLSECGNPPRYVGSTTWSRTCREAAAEYLASHDGELRSPTAFARFAK